MIKDMRFEEAMECLEDITRKLESGQLPLEESIREYERAVELIKICNAKLEAAEKKVKMLIEAPDGTVSVQDFARSDAN